MEKDLFSEITLVAIQAALKSAEILKQGFGTHFKIDKKEGKHNLVTEYDLKSEKSIISFIQKRFENHSFLCEEEGSFGSNSNEIRWIIDPLDGTVNFAHNIPMFAVSIAALKNNETISGVVIHPITNEIFIAEKSKGSYLNGNKLQVSDTKKLDDAILATGFPYNLSTNPEKCFERFTEVLKLGIPIRRLGAATLDLSYLAAGRFDGYWEMGLGPWDCAAAALIIEEAGGLISHIDGSEFVIGKKNAIIASNKHLHEQLIEILNNDY